MWAGYHADVTPSPTPKRLLRRRKRIGHLTLCVSFLFLLVLFAQCRRKTPVAVVRPPTVVKPGTLKGVTVVIDPGHGGADSGAIQGGVSESALTYRTAATLATALHTAGAEVFFTVYSKTLAYAPKEGQTEPPLELPTDARFAVDNKHVGLRRGESPEDLYRRAKLAAGVWQKRGRQRRVFFISLHFDALSERKWRGGLACYDKRRPSPPKLVQVVARKLGEAGLSGQRRGGQPKPRELGVLNPSHNPVTESALVELATISNAKDRAEASSPSWRWKVAHLLTDAIAECR